MKNSVKIIISLIAIAACYFVINDLFTSVAGGASIAFALAGYVRPCTAKSSGIRKLYLTEKANVTDFTLAGELFTAVTMDGAAVFYEYEFEQDTCSMKETVSFENSCKKVTHDIEVKLDQMTEDTRLEIEALADASHCGLIGFAIDMNGNQWTLGYSDELKKDRPLRMVTATGDTGKALTDASGETLAFQAIDTRKARKYTGTIPA